MHPTGVEPVTAWFVVKYSIQLSYGCIVYLINAEDRGRTGTVITDRRILSPVRLPIPPPRHGPWFYIGKAEDGVRTRDPHLGKVVFYHWTTSAIWFKCRLKDLNPRPSDYKSDALPTELSRLSAGEGTRTPTPRGARS